MNVAPQEATLRIANGVAAGIRQEAVVVLGSCQRCVRGGTATGGGFPRCVPNVRSIRQMHERSIHRSHLAHLDPLTTESLVIPVIQAIAMPAGTQVVGRHGGGCFCSCEVEGVSHNETEYRCEEIKYFKRLLFRKERQKTTTS